MLITNLYAEFHFKHEISVYIVSEEGKREEKEKEEETDKRGNSGREWNLIRKDEGQ